MLAGLRSLQRIACALLEEHARERAVAAECPSPKSPPRLARLGEGERPLDGAAGH